MSSFIPTMWKGRCIEEVLKVREVFEVLKVS